MNTSNTFRRSSQQTELKALQYFLDQNFQFLYWRKKIFKIEVDLVFLSKTGELTLVEVKSLSNDWSLPYRVSAKQRARLENCRMLCENQFQIPTQILYVYVSEREVIVLDNIGESHF